MVIVTGASAGIGAETARLFARHGAKVALVARSTDKLKAVAAHLPDSLVVPTDLRDPAAVQAMVDIVMTQLGRIDVLVNNAGQAQYGPVERADLNEFRQIVELNVYAPLVAMQAVTPIMRSQGGGVIVNVSSMVSKMFIPGLATYASTKYALNALTLTARAELAPDNIRVGVVYPRLTNTDFGRNALGMRRTERPAGMPAGDSPELVAKRILDAVESERAETYMDETPPEQGAWPGTSG